MPQPKPRSPSRITRDFALGYAAEDAFASAIPALGGTARKHNHTPSGFKQPRLIATDSYGRAEWIVAPNYEVSFPGSPTYHVEVKTKQLYSKGNDRYFFLDEKSHHALMRCLDSQRRTLLAVNSPQLSKDPLRAGGVYLDAEDLRPGNVRLRKRNGAFLIPLEMFRPLRELPTAHLQFDGTVTGNTTASASL